MLAFGLLVFVLPFLAQASPNPSLMQQPLPQCGPKAANAGCEVRLILLMFNFVLALIGLEITLRKLLLDQRFLFVIYLHPIHNEARLTE